MERINVESERKIILIEHRHRYEWISNFAKGNVLDIACGVGYGSQVLASGESVRSYIGMDVSQEALDIATTKYLNQSNIRFKLASLERIPLLNSSMDTVVSLETLEHVDNVEQSIKEIERVLAPGGLFIGSVPTKSMELRCREVYGENPYHKRMFSIDDIEKALRKRFKFIIIGNVSTSIGSLFRFGNTPEDFSSTIHDQNIRLENKLGSFLFIASNKTLENEVKIANEFSFNMDIVDYDSETTHPLRLAFDNTEKLVAERDDFIKQMKIALDNTDKLVAERDLYIKQLEDRLNLYSN